MIFSEQDTLPNGVTIPRLALGTWFLPNQQAAEAVKTALSIGYRHIDTAQAYGNEAGVGEGIRRSGIPREEIFVTSKVVAEHKSYATAAQSIHQTLTTMGLDYVDLMLIHSPQPWAEVNQSDNRYFPENRQVWRALEDALSAGKVRAIGVSVPQLCIRYDLQLGMVVLPKAANPEHMRENASLDFTISEEDMDQLLRLPPIQDYGPFRHFPVFGGKKNG